MKRRNGILTLIIILLMLGLVLSRIHFFRAGKNSADFNRNTTLLIYTKHARCRMACRHIDESEVKEILQTGIINYAKSEPHDKPDPKYALEGRTHDGQQVRIIFAPSSRGMLVITVIDLQRQWQCECQ